MQDSTKERLLESAIETALGDEEVMRHLAELGIESEAAREHCRRESDRLWETVSRRVAKVESLDRSIGAAKRRASIEARRLRDTSSPSSAPGASDSTGASSHTDARHHLPWSRHEPAKRTRQIEERAHDQLQGSAAWRELTGRRDRANDRLREALVQEAVLPSLYGWITDEIGRQNADAPYRSTLDVADTGSLRQKVDAEKLVQTAALQEIDHLVNRTTEASIGVAGPRGSGKSTLLARQCEGSSPLNPRLRVSAPVDYTPREFLLHIYGQLCKEILQCLHRETVLGGVTAKGRQLAARLVIVGGLASFCGLLGVADYAARTDLGSNAGALPLLVAVVAAGLAAISPLAGSSYLASLAIADSPLSGTAPAERIRRAISWVNVSVALAMTALVGMLLGRSHGSTDIISERRITAVLLLFAACGIFVSRWASAAATSSPLLAVTVRRALTAVAAATTAFGLGLLLPVEIFRPDLRLVTASLLLTAGLAALACAVSWLEAAARLRGHSDPLHQRAVQLATDGRRRLRIQRSTASTRTANLKLGATALLPFGVDAGRSGTTTDTELAMNTPEIVDAIHELLDAQHSTVVAIDELDKLESEDRACAFLNEIKGIFTAPRTHFLVSMSEDAIASFERRGLTFRDVFDSSFDEIVRTPYLTLQQSRELVNNRAIAVPIPFIALAQCLSGGLPRDLLRALDQMIVITAPTRSLSHIASAMVHRELRQRCQGMIAALRPIPLEPQVTEVLVALYRIDRCPQDGVDLERCVLRPKWLQLVDELDLHKESIGDNDLVALRTLQRLGGEFTSFGYFCRTLLEFLDTASRAGLERFKTAEHAARDQPESLDYLTRARQNIAVNPHLAWDQVSKFRREHQLRPFTFDGPGEARWRSVGVRTRMRRTPVRARGRSAMDPRKTAVVLIEFQNDFTSEGGALHGAVSDTMESTGMLANAKKVAEVAREAGATVVHAPISFANGYQEITAHPYGILKGVVDNNAFVKGTWGAEIVADLTPDADDIVVEGKRGLDAFASTNLDFILRSKGVETIALGGFLTNCCVESTMRSAYERGYEVVTLTDCVAATSAEEHRNAITYDYPMFSKPMSAEEFAGTIERGAAAGDASRGY